MTATPASGGNDELIQRFYAAFNRHDGDAMAGCYAPDAHFKDPVFGDLHGAEPGAMWRMLTGRSEDLTVDLAGHEATGDTGSARWIAHYTFTQTGRTVRNDVRAAFRFRGGLIVDHVDTFSLWSWTRQALGPVGLVAGWTPPVQSGVRRKARAGLDAYLKAGPTPSNGDQA